MTTPMVTGPRWVDLPYHRRWLIGQANALFDFFEPNSIDPDGGFYVLDDQGKPILKSRDGGKAPAREIHSTTRMVHCFAIARLLGRPDAWRFIDHGMDFIWNRHRDAVNGGYVWSVGKDGPGDDRKLAYGHAFVLLAASSAKVAGHPDADRLLSDIAEVLHARFWDKAAGASREEFRHDWSEIGGYRGQNSNMHLTEAAMAAFEATGDRAWLEMAESIAALIINRHAAAVGGRVPEHFTENWEIDRDYLGDPVFRPPGYTPGHWLEWTRLLLQLWELGGRVREWIPGAARRLFANAVAEGWDTARGGFVYTLDWQSRPQTTRRLFWPQAEGIGAVAFLNAIDGGDLYESWYRRMWDFVSQNLIDRDNGGWRSEALEAGRAGLLRGQARHLSRAAGVPHPAAPHNRHYHPRTDRKSARSLAATAYAAPKANRPAPRGRGPRSLQSSQVSGGVVQAHAIPFGGIAVLVIRRRFVEGVLGEVGENQQVAVVVLADIDAFERDGYRLLANAEESANINDHGVDLAVLCQNDVANAAQILVVCRVDLFVHEVLGAHLIDWRRYGRTSGGIFIRHRGSIRRHLGVRRIHGGAVACRSGSARRRGVGCHRLLRDGVAAGTGPICDRSIGARIQSCGVEVRRALELFLGHRSNDDRLIIAHAPLQVRICKRDVLLANAKEPAYADDHGLNLAAVVDHDVVDRADRMSVSGAVVVYRGAHQLAGEAVIGSRRRKKSLPTGCRGRGRCRDRCRRGRRGSVGWAGDRNEGGRGKKLLQHDVILLNLAPRAGSKVRCRS